MIPPHSFIIDNDKHKKKSNNNNMNRYLIQLLFIVIRFQGEQATGENE